MKVALICTTALTITYAILVMVSDLFLRPQNIPGANPLDWDITGSVLLGWNIFAIAWAFFFGDR